MRLIVEKRTLNCLIGGGGEGGRGGGGDGGVMCWLFLFCYSVDNLITELFFMV